MSEVLPIVMVNATVLHACCAIYVQQLYTPSSNDSRVTSNNKLLATLRCTSIAIRYLLSKNRDTIKSISKQCAPDHIIIMLFDLTSSLVNCLHEN